MIQPPRQTPPADANADPKSLESLPLPLFRELDDVCIQFEAAWQKAGPSGSGPQVEDYLTPALPRGHQTLPGERGRLGPDEPASTDIMDQWRQALVGELVRIDIAYRRRAGQTPRPQEYLHRFPSLDPGWLTGALAEQTPRSLPAVTPEQPGIRTTTCAKAPLQAATSPFLTLPARFDDYELLEEVARGGMGVVYKARQLSLNRLVALKMILDSGPLTEEAVRRFHREAQVAAALDHPNIVAIHASGQHLGRPFFTMAYVEGDTLREVVRQHGLPSSEQAADWLRVVAEAVAFAHQHRIIHRDLKPENVLIDRQGRPRVTDFGLAYQLEAEALSDRLTRTGQVLGTPAFMAPEQAMGKIEAIGPATDVYSLGGTLYFLLTGQLPFQGRSATEVLCQVLTAAPPPPRQVNPQASAELEAVCLRCLEKDPAKRYSSAEALADALRAAGEPPDLSRRSGSPLEDRRDKPGGSSATGEPPVAAPRRRKWKAHLVRVGLAAVTLVCLVAGVWLAAAPGWRVPRPPDNALPVELPPPERLRTDFGLEVTMVGKWPKAAGFASAVGQAGGLPNPWQAGWVAETKIKTLPGGGLVGLRPGADGVLRLQEGEEVKFRVKVAQPAYVGIWSVNGDGTIDQLFPNAKEEDHSFRQDEERRVPTTRAAAVKSKGLQPDWIWVQASTEPWKPDEGQRRDPFLLFKEDRERALWEQHRRGIRLQPEGTLAETVLKLWVEVR